MSDLVRGLRYFPVTMPRWDVRVTFVRAEDDTLYVPVRPLCREMGVDAAAQLERINEDPRYVDALVELRVPTPGGLQKTWCLRKREAAWWLGSINPAKCKIATRGPLQDFQTDLMAEADRLVFGDLSAVLQDGQLQRYQPIRGELHFGCPRCGAPLCFVVEDGGMHLRVNP